MNNSGNEEEKSDKKPILKRRYSHGRTRPLRTTIPGNIENQDEIESKLIFSSPLRRQSETSVPEKIEDNDETESKLFSSIRKNSYNGSTKFSKFLSSFHRKIEPLDEKIPERKLEDPSVTKIRDRINEEFPYESYFKYIAWLLAILIIFTANVVIIYKGFFMETAGGALWLGTSILSLILLFFIFHPIVIIIYAIATKYIYDFYRELHYKEIPENLFHNPYDEDKAEEVKEFRLNNITSYMPTPELINRQKRFEIFHKTQRKNFCKDTTATVVLLMILLVIVFTDHSNYAIFLRRTVINLVNEGRYTNSIRLGNVSSYEQFQDYLKHTFIPALLTNSSDIVVPNMEIDASDGYFLTELYDRGWTRDLHVKLIGQPRILQKRVQSRSCNGKISRHDSCENELNSINHDSEDYGVGWEPLLPGENDVNQTEVNPWIYQPWSKVQTSPWFGKLASFITYGQGGYVIYLGKSITNAEITHNFINYFNWIDHKTRAIFIDFVIYAPGADLFNIATIGFEVSATGIFIPSFRMNAGTLLNKEPTNYAIVFIKLAMLIICVEYLFQNIVSKCGKVGLKAYFSSGWGLLNVWQVEIGIISIIATVQAIFYASMVDDEMDSVSEDQFVNFQLVGFWTEDRNYFIAFFITIEIIKIIHHLRYLQPFHEFHRTIAKALPCLLVISFWILLTCLQFTVIFRELIGLMDERLSSLIYLLAHGIAFDETIDFSNKNLPILNGILYIIFLLTTCYFIVGMMQVILAVNFESVNLDPVEIPHNQQKKLPILRTRPNFHNSGIYINTLRLIHMKRVVLQILTKKNVSHDTALSIIAFIFSQRDPQQASSEKYYQVRGKTYTLTLDREKLMKGTVEEIWNSIIRHRQDHSDRL